VGTKGHEYFSIELWTPFTYTLLTRYEVQIMWVHHAMNHLLEKAFTHSQLQDAGIGDISIQILQIR